MSTTNTWSVPENNWTETTRTYIANKEFDARIAFKIGPNPDPAPGCRKSFQASYVCSPKPMSKTKTISINRAAGKTAIFDCSSEYAKCTKGILTLRDDGNLVLTSNNETLWQSGTNKVGTPLEKYSAINGKYKRNYLKTGEFLYPNEFIGSPSGNCVLLCDKTDNECSLSVVYYLMGCNMPGAEPSDVSGNNNGYVTDIDGYRATYSINDTNQDKSLNGKVLYINSDMEKMEYPESMLGLSKEYIHAGNYNQTTETIKTISNSDLDNCKLECSAIDNCYGFIHHETTKQCDLKNKANLFPTNLNRILSKDAKMFVRKYKIAGPNSCNGTITETNISGDNLIKLAKGPNMTPDTLCTLGEAMSEQLEIVRKRELALNTAVTEISDNLTKLNTKNNRLDRDVNAVGRTIHDNADSYKKVITDTNRSKDDIDNITAMSSESKLENVRQNFNYMIWTAVATIAVVTIIKTTSSQ